VGVTYINRKTVDIHHGPTPNANCLVTRKLTCFTLGVLWPYMVTWQSMRVWNLGPSLLKIFGGKSSIVCVSMKSHH